MLNPSLVPGWRHTIRIGVTGLARAGKTAFLTSAAANLLAQGAGVPTLPLLAARLAGRRMRVSLAPSGAEALPRFGVAAHLAALAADPPRWPERTGAVSLLALHLDVSRAGLSQALPPMQLRLELLDYPGEWLLDLPMLRQSFSEWSAATLRRLEGHEAAAGFLAFARGLPAGAGADDTLAMSGHRLFADALGKLRERGLSFLQPGRFLMPAPGPPPPWTAFFPMQGGGGLADLMRQRFDAYREAAARELSAPSFGRLDGLVVLADVLSALHAGPAAFADMQEALSAVAGALRYRGGLLGAVPLLGALAPWMPDFLPDWLSTGGIARVAFAATKADHVAQRQRGNLENLARGLVTLPGERAPGGVFAIASVRCTEDFVWTLDGRNVSAVRGRVLGEPHFTRSYPGEVPDRAPDASFWQHRFLALPQFEPARLPEGGRAGVPSIGLDALLAYLLEDVL
jgi:predicted YcjX-like family ATPase